MTDEEWPGAFSRTIRVDNNGNVHPDDAREIADRVRQILGCTCEPLLYIDLRKDPRVTPEGVLSDGTAVIHMAHAAYCATSQPTGGL
jgi:hypothetical protein